MAAERAAQMGARLNQRLMTFARQRRLEPVATNLNDLTRAMLDLLQRSVGESISIDCRLEAEPALALVDASEMENALLNLALNARDAMGSGGTLLLETSNCEFDGDGAAQVGGITPGRYTCLSVSDTGTGMSEEVLARAFDPFFTTKEPGKGTGLGLTSLHGFVRQSGGNVLLYSEVGHGTSVKIYLPSLDGGTEAPSISVPAPATTTGQGEAVLLVEDNAAVRAVTRDRLLQLGYRVVEAGDAAAALAVLDRDKSIDVVLSDIIMPGGMTGADLAKKIRLTRPQLPVILTSGFAGEMVQKHLSEVSPSAILRKPYGIDELARALQQALERR